MKLIFLGTGGGRHVMFSQVRATGGLLFDLDDVKFIIDPGPGSLVNARALGLDVGKWNGVLVSHLHPDNCSDANVLLDGMKEPFVVAEEHCILPMGKIKSKNKAKPRGGAKGFQWYPVISYYHQNNAESVHAVKHRDRIKVRNLEIEAYHSEHYDPTVGFVVAHPKIKIGYPADGPYYAGQEKHYDGCDVLILNVLVPKGKKPVERKHMSVDDAIKLVNGMQKKPRLIVMQHFSFWILRNNVWKQAKILQDATKVRVLHAEDFMELDLGNFNTNILKKK
jgi:ribonuclease BN (tRNA processing enzyme)